MKQSIASAMTSMSSSVRAVICSLVSPVCLRSKREITTTGNALFQSIMIFSSVLLSACPYFLTLPVLRDTAHQTSAKWQDGVCLCSTGRSLVQWLLLDEAGHLLTLAIRLS